MADFIPSNDTQFNAWLVNLTAAIRDNAALYGISNDISTALQTILPIWQGALADFVREEEAFHAATRNKNEKRAQMEAQVRAINGISQNFPGITEALLEAAAWDYGGALPGRGRKEAQWGDRLPGFAKWPGGATAHGRAATL